MKSFLVVFLFCVATAAQAQQINWAQHIAPIIYKNCTTCHRSGEIAPTQLYSYQDALNDLSLIRSYVDQRVMPPWKPDSGYGSFLDERRLSQTDIDLIDRWVDGGAPRGDSTLEPPVPTFPTGSQLGVPDLVLKMPTPYLHKGNHQDMYRCFVLPTGLLQDKNVSAVEFRPGNAKIVHHALFYLDSSGAGRALDDADPGEGYTDFGGVGFNPIGTLGGWVPGYTPRFFPPNIAWQLPKHSDLVVQIHYAPTDSDQYDQSSINIFYCHDANPRNVIVLQIDPSNMDVPFVIPPNKVQHFIAEYDWTQFINISLLGVAPHMHLLGKMMKVYAVTTLGDTQPIIWIKDWEFHWQGLYTFQHLMKVTPGTRIFVESEYDNTTDNPDNPNSPPKQVQWGESTTDEMMLCYFFGMIYLPGDENINMATTATTAVGDGAAQPSVIELLPPYADPASTTLSIPFALASDANIRLSLFDMMGNEVARLADNQSLPAGPHLKECSVASLPAGAYMCRLSSGSSMVSRQVRVVR